ncbi:hypothetical protein QYH43_10320 [Pseudomonas sp. C32]|nr:hypothetical protein [Pseudomonas sp. C32]MDN4544870.1 hypothetical protein [Pseudomonas sp. C32]
MGRRRPPAATDPAQRRPPRLQLQRLRQGHRRTRRTRAHHPLRVRRRPASGQPPPQPRRHAAQLPLRPRAAAAHRDRERVRRALSPGLHGGRIDPTGNRLRWAAHRVCLRPQRPVAGENRVWR